MSLVGDNLARHSLDRSSYSPSLNTTYCQFTFDLCESYNLATEFDTVFANVVY